MIGRRPLPLTLALALVMSTLTVATQQRVEARAVEGRRAPWFRLKTMKGATFTHRKLGGRPALLVVGRTQKAAPLCKRWMLTLVSRIRPAVTAYQVIVVDKAWYIPRSAVLSRIKGFTPGRWHHRVLIEWYTVFADVWGVALHDDPVVFLLDRHGVLRWRRRGPLTKPALASLERTLERLR